MASVYLGGKYKNRDIDIFKQITKDFNFFIISLFFANMPGYLSTMTKMPLKKRNVCSAEKYSKRSSVLLLHLVSFSAEQTLYEKLIPYCKSESLMYFNFYRPYKQHKMPFCILKITK